MDKSHRTWLKPTIGHRTPLNARESLPYTCRCHHKYYQQEEGVYVEAIVLQFRPDSLGKVTGMKPFEY